MHSHWPLSRFIHNMTVLSSPDVASVVPVTFHETRSTLQREVARKVEGADQALSSSKAWGWLHNKNGDDAEGEEGVGRTGAYVASLRLGERQHLLLLVLILCSGNRTARRGVHAERGDLPDPDLLVAARGCQQAVGPPHRRGKGNVVDRASERAQVLQHGCPVPAERDDACEWSRLCKNFARPNATTSAWGTGHGSLQRQRYRCGMDTVRGGSISGGGGGASKQK